MKRIAWLCIIIIVISLGVIYEAKIYEKVKDSINQQKIITDKKEPSTADTYQSTAIKSLACFQDQKTLPEQIWILSKLYKQTQNNKYLDLLNDKIGQFQSTENYSSPLMCKIFSEVVTQNILKNDQVETLKNICLNSPNNKITNTLIKKLKANNKQNSLESIYKTKDEVKKIVFYEVDDTTNVTNLSLLSSDNIGDYYFSQNQDSLVNSQILFQKAFATYLEKMNIEFVEACTLGSSALDIFSLTKTNLYMDIANLIANRINNIKNSKNINLSTKSSCASFLTKYSKLNTNPEASELIKFLLNSSIDSNFDDKDFPGFTSDSKCFIDFENKKLFFENSLIIGSLIDNK